MKSQNIVEGIQRYVEDTLGMNSLSYVNLMVGDSQMLFASHKNERSCMCNASIY